MNVRSGCVRVQGVIFFALGRENNPIEGATGG